MPSSTLKPSEPSTLLERDVAEPEVDVSDDEALVQFTGLAGYIGYALRRATAAVVQDFVRSLAEFDIRPTQFGVLSIIQARPGLKQQQVSSALGVQRSNFVTLFDELERRGLAYRAPAAGDRRSYALYLTDHGKGVMDRLLVAHKRHEQRLAELIGVENRDSFLTQLNALSKIGSPS